MTTLPALTRGPVGVDGFFQPRRFAFWTFIVLIANGVFVVATQLISGSQVVPLTIFLAVVVWGLYAALPLWFFNQRLDLFAQHPPLGFVMAFAWGAFGAIYLAANTNTPFINVLSKTVSPEFAARWGAAIVGPTTEETLKILGVILLILIARTQFRTILSVVSVGVLVGLGFQVSEDFSYTLNVAIAYPGPNQVAPVLQMLAFRGVLSGLWSHALFTSIASFGVGYFLTRRTKPLATRLAVAIGSFLIAWGCHFFWNSPVGESNIVLLVLRGVPIFVVGALLWWLAGRDEGGTLLAIAEHYVPDDVITPEERSALGSLRLRRHLRKQARKEHGRTAGRLYHELQRKQLHLVMEYGQTGANPRTELAAIEVRLIRDRYERAAGLTPPIVEEATVS